MNLELRHLRVVCAIAETGSVTKAASQLGLAQPALTRWRVLATSASAHLLELTPETGRMHQLRAHLSIAGRPILGDPYYGGAATLQGQPVPRLMLHAHSLDLPHPSGGPLVLKSQPPKDFLAVLSVAGIDLALRPD